jgi:hypothetical protein
MGLFNTSGIITQGYGKDQRIITQGYGSSFEVGGISIIEKEKNYQVNIYGKIQKEGNVKLDINIPLEIKKEKIFEFLGTISQEKSRNILIKQLIDLSKISDILDEI